MCGVGEIVRLAGVAPVPENAAEADPPGDALACRLALFAPPEVGAKAPSTVQLEPGASVWPLQLSADLVNWSASPPPTDVVIVPLGASPVLVTVKVWAGEVVPMTCVPKSLLPAASARLAGASPVPESVAEAPPPGTAMPRARVLGPVEVGAKATSKLQLSPPPRAAVHVLAESGNCAASPEIAIAGTPLGASPLLVRVKVWTGEVVPVTRLPKRPSPARG